NARRAAQSGRMLRDDYAARRHLPAGRRDREHRAQLRRPGRDRHSHRGHGAPVQRGAARSDAVILELRQHAAQIVKRREPGLMVDGEMQADTAVTPEIIEQTYPFSTLRGGANVLIFPNLESGNIAYKLLACLGGAELIGPIIMGLAKPMHVLQRGAEVNDIVNMASIAV